MKYGKLLDNGAVEYAKTTIDMGNVVYVNPPAEVYKQHGWLPIEEGERPIGSVSFKWSLSEDGGKILKTWAPAPEAKPVATTYSKLKVCLALVSRGLWAKFKEAMELNYVADGLTYWEAFLMAQDLSSTHPMFSTALLKVLAALEVSDETREEILADCEAD